MLNMLNNSMTRLLLPSLVASLMVASFAAGDAHAQRRKVREVRKDTRELQNDRNDRARFNAFVREVKTHQGKPKQMAAFDARVIAAMGTEVRESKRELHQDKRELRQDRKAVRRSKNKIVKLGKKVQRADDRRDRNVEAKDLAQVNALRARYVALRGKANAVAVGKKVVILEKLAGMAAAEVRGDKRERREDRGNVKRRVIKKRLRR